MKKSEILFIAFHKPYGVLSQFTSDLGKKTLADFNLPTQIYAAGRLDQDSEGLLLLTNDGAFIKKITDPQSKTMKTYWAQVEKIPTQQDLDKLRSGVTIKGGHKTAPCKVNVISPDIEERNPPIRERKSIPTSWLEITIHEGKNRQVRRMTAAIGFPTLRLIRVKIGKLNLELEPGQYRTVSVADIF
jgi:23S rRNA pseudouridine2457 synthase